MHNSDRLTKAEVWQPRHECGLVQQLVLTLILQTSTTWSFLLSILQSTYCWVWSCCIMFHQRTVWSAKLCCLSQKLAQVMMDLAMVLFYKIYLSLVIEHEALKRLWFSILLTWLDFRFSTSLTQWVGLTCIHNLVISNRPSSEVILQMTHICPAMAIPRWSCICSQQDSKLHYCLQVCTLLLQELGMACFKMTVQPTDLRWSRLCNTRVSEFHVPTPFIFCCV